MMDGKEKPMHMLARPWLHVNGRSTHQICLSECTLRGEMVNSDYYVFLAVLHGMLRAECMCLRGGVSSRGGSDGDECGYSQ